MPFQTKFRKARAVVEKKRLMKAAHVGLLADDDELDLLICDGQTY